MIKVIVFVLKINIMIQFLVAKVILFKLIIYYFLKLNLI